MQMHATDIARSAAGYRKCFTVGAKSESHHFIEGAGNSSRLGVHLKVAHFNGARTTDEQVFAIRRKSQRGNRRGLQREYRNKK